MLERRMTLVFSRLWHPFLQHNCLERVQFLFLREVGVAAEGSAAVAAASPLVILAVQRILSTSLDQTTWCQEPRLDRLY